MGLSFVDIHRKLTRHRLISQIECRKFGGSCLLTEYDKFPSNDLVETGLAIDLTLCVSEIICQCPARRLT